MAKKKRVLVVEDEPSLQDALAYNLTRQDYKVYQAMTGFEAIEIARNKKPDLIILDIMLPGIDGFEVCRILRKEMSTPILMLTAKDEEIDKVVGLEVGADDYMTKPFGIRELLARVKALLRRDQLIREELAADTGEDEAAIVDRQQSQQRLIFDDLVIDLDRREVSLQDEALRLKPKEYELLLFLARNRGIALSRELILERVWGWEYDGGSRTVDVHVRWLRAKIEPNPAEATRIVTVRSVGYRFEG